jgi:hypothetical protein
MVGSAVEHLEEFGQGCGQLVDGGRAESDGFPMAGQNDVRCQLALDGQTRALSRDSVGTAGASRLRAGRKSRRVASLAAARIGGALRRASGYRCGTQVRQYAQRR